MNGNVSAAALQEAIDKAVGTPGREAGPSCAPRQGEDAKKGDGDRNRGDRDRDRGDRDRDRNNNGNNND